MNRFLSAVFKWRSSDFHQAAIFGIISCSFYLLSYLAINSNPGEFLNSLLQKEIKKNAPVSTVKRSFGSNGGAPKPINGFNGR